MTTTRSLRGLVVAAAMLLALGVGAPAAAAATAGDFSGLWISRDANDGSLQTLRIGPDLELKLFDTRASVCAFGSPAVVTGVGAITGETLTAELTIDCLVGPDPDFTPVGAFTLTAPRVLVDDLGVGGTVWRRVGR